MRVAIVGAGWAGLTAAVRAVEDGHQVTLYEANKNAGGRARAIAKAEHCLVGHALDNGQHILIAAYTETLRVMRHVGVNPETHLLTLPLTLRYPDGNGLQLPNWPLWTGPAELVWGIATAKGWTWRDKLALIRTAVGWQLAGFKCQSRISVADLCANLPPCINEGFIEPLCVSALNTPAHQASGQVFLRVLQDAMFGTPGGSRLMLPTSDLGTLFPESALAWLTRQGTQVLLGERVVGLLQGSDHWQVQRQSGEHQQADHVILATPSSESVRLLRSHTTGLDAGQQTAVDHWIEPTQALHFEAIATVYAQCHATLPHPMLALRPSAEQPAQFVFDRGQLGGPQGLLAFVVSASQGNRASLEAKVVQQAHHQLGYTVNVLQTIVEKRATFACTPGLQRPPSMICRGLSACGDYLQGPYPATLEGAVRSGWAAGGLSVKPTERTNPSGRPP